MEASMYPHRQGCSNLTRNSGSYVTCKGRGLQRRELVTHACNHDSRRLLSMSKGEVQLEETLKRPGFENLLARVKTIVHNDNRTSLRVEESLNRSGKDIQHIKPTGNSRHSSNLCSSELRPRQLGAMAASCECYSMRHTDTREAQDGEDWRILARAITTDQKIGSISNHGLMHIAGLRFSSDMQDGDSGDQVALLQKALFLLGYLSHESAITGYFGGETKKALCEFQEAHGVHRTGTWGALSKQALWHSVSGEILHRASLEKGASETPATTVSEDAQSAYKSGSLVPPWQLWIPITFDGFHGDWKLFLSSMVLLLAGILFGVIISKFSTRQPRESTVHRKIIMDRKQANSTAPVKSYSGSQIPLPGKAYGGKNSFLDIDKTLSDPMKAEQGSSHISLTRSKQAVFTDLPLNDSRSPISTSTSSSYKPSGKLVRPARVNSPNVQSLKTRIQSLQRDGHNGSRLVAKGNQAQALNQARTVFSNGQLEGSDGISKLSLRHNIPSSSANEGKKGREFKKIENKTVFPATQNYGDEDDQERVQLEENEMSIRKRIDELRKAVEAAERNGQAAVDALTEERRRSLELEAKITKQREAAASLEEEVRILKESHDALLVSLREKLKSALATRGASLLYQNFSHNNDSNGGS